MTLVPPAVLTTTQLVGGIVASAKNAVDLAKVSSNHELKAALNELYDSVLDVKARVLDLDEENRRLKEELGRREEIIGPEGKNGFFFYKAKPDKPLCPVCWQSATKKNPVFLVDWDAYGPGYRCVICNGLWDK